MDNPGTPVVVRQRSPEFSLIFRKWGTDEKGLFKFFCAAPSEHLKKLNLIYADKYGYTLLKVMEKELGTSLPRGLRGHPLRPYILTSDRGIDGQVVMPDALACSCLV